ncbi:Hypothetical_protein [Hexamita inflata]|nr:Hypothetical protein HINF_LOCUS56414 [Hexamita inflata]CAI9968772.1 Hypothetical protein HINF_LOCUS56417 [Hexamita inflata]
MTNGARDKKYLNLANLPFQCTSVYQQYQRVYKSNTIAAQSTCGQLQPQGQKYAQRLFRSIARNCIMYCINVVGLNLSDSHIHNLIWNIYTNCQNFMITRNNTLLQQKQ